MISVDELKQAFNDKLAQTGSLDSAFTKAVWIAYKQGLNDMKCSKCKNELTQMEEAIFNYVCEEECLNPDEKEHDALCSICVHIPEVTQ
jgi:hypothetical protein